MSASEKLKALDGRMPSEPWMTSKTKVRDMKKLRDALPQIVAVVEAAEQVLAYDDAVIEWDSMKAHDVATAKAKRALSDRATELNHEAFAANRLALAALEKALS